jgi:hypothetical protein
MPTKRKRRVHTWQPAIDPAVIAYLETGDAPEDCGFETWQLVHGASEALRPMWAAAREAILRDWIPRHPGRRPFGWWRYDSPEPARRRVGGVGDDYAAAGWAQTYRNGLPELWLDRWLCAFYRGEAVDVNLIPIATEYRERTPRWPHVGIDPHNPPAFESEAAFLQRHRLLARDERRRLTARDFEPERIVVAEDEDTITDAPHERRHTT